MLLICRWPNGKHECANVLKPAGSDKYKKEHAKFDNNRPGCSTRLRETVGSHLKQSRRFKWSVTAQHQSRIDHDDDRETIMLMGLIDWKITHTGGVYWICYAVAIKQRVNLTGRYSSHSTSYVCI